jgi:hypothetical protein
MATWRIGAVLLLASIAADAFADGRSASFNVSVRVVTTLRSRGQVVVPPASFLVVPGRAALPCGAPSSDACRDAAASASLASGAAVTLTSFTDGTPPAVVER